MYMYISGGMLKSNIVTELQWFEMEPLIKTIISFIFTSAVLFVVCGMEWQKQAETSDKLTWVGLQSLEYSLIRELE